MEQAQAATNGQVAEGSNRVFSACARSQTQCGDAADRRRWPRCHEGMSTREAVSSLLGRKPQAGNLRPPHHLIARRSGHAQPKSRQGDRGTSC